MTKVYQNFNVKISRCRCGRYLQTHYGLRVSCDQPYMTMAPVAIELALLLLCVALHLIAADISSENPPIGSCLCLTASSVNVRDTGLFKLFL